MIKKTVRQFLFLSGLLWLGMTFSTATYVTFLMSRGLNLFEVNFVNVVFFTTMFFFELPTGAFADTWGRKTSFVIACGLAAAGEIVYFCSYSLIGFFLAEILVGIGRSFANGAFHAWLIDTVKYHGYKGNTDEFFRKESVMKRWVGIPAAVAGSIAGTYNLAIPWLIGGCIVLVTCIIAAFTMKETSVVGTHRSFSEKYKSMYSNSKKAAEYARTDKNVRFVIIMHVIFMFAIQPLNMYWQPFFKPFLHEQYWFGLVWIGMSLTILLGASISGRVTKRAGGHKIGMIVTQGITGVGMIAAAIMQPYFIPSLLLFWIHEIPRGAFEPIRDAHINNVITDDKQRATILSCKSAYGHFGSLAGLLISGAIAENYGIKYAWICSGVLLITIPLLMIRNGRRQ